MREAGRHAEAGLQAALRQCRTGKGVASVSTVGTGEAERHSPMYCWEQENMVVYEGGNGPPTQAGTVKKNLLPA